MKFGIAHIMVAAGAAFAICAAAIAQDATTQPAPDASPAVVDRQGNNDQPTSRPSSSRFDNARNNRRDRNNRNDRRPGQQNASSNPQSNQQALYEQVGSRDIFVKGNQQTPEAIVNSGPALSPDQLRAQQAETQLILTGVSLADNGKIALMENRSDYSVTQLKIGDAVANGKVVNITLDSLDYKDKSGRIVRVAVGFNLSGGDVWGISGSSSSGGTASTQPAKSGPRLPGESMEDYLKRRRAAEVGH